MLSDAELVKRVRYGETDAFAVLVRRYERIVRGVTLSAVGDRHSAEDVVQEAFLAAFQSLASLREPSKFGTWLVSISRYQSVRALRKTARVEPLLDDVSDRHLGPGLQLTEQSERLMVFVDRLPDYERVVVGLRYFEGLSVKEVAAVTGRSVGTVTKQLSRAHQRLKRWLTQETRV